MRELWLHSSLFNLLFPGPSVSYVRARKQNRPMKDLFYFVAQIGLEPMTLRV